MRRPAAAASPLHEQPRSGRVPERKRGLHLAGCGTGQVRRLLDAGGLRPAASLLEAVGPAIGHGARAGMDRAWPVAAPLAGLLPAGVLRRGSVVAVVGSTSLLWAVTSAASQAGAWVAAVGMPEAGLLAAAEHGIALDRLALVPHPGTDWPTVVGALLDGVDLVVVHPPAPATAAAGRRLTARVRQRSAVLLPTGEWAGAEATLRAGDAQWHGLGQGHGRLRFRQLAVTAEGRGSLARPRRVQVWMPAPDGTAIAPATAGTTATVTHLSRAA